MIKIKRSVIALATALLLSRSGLAEFVYYRCIDPPNSCIALTETDEANCPDCKKWEKVFLDFDDVMKNARKEQKQSGVPSKHVATNYFADAITEQLYGIDLTTTAGAPPKTREIGKHPDKYGLQTVTGKEPKVGQLAIVGDIAGVVTQQNGKIVIAYPSHKTGEVKLVSPSVLEKAENDTIKYLAPKAEHHE